MSTGTARTVAKAQDHIVFTGLDLIAFTGLDHIAFTGLDLIAFTGLDHIAFTGLDLIAFTGLDHIAFTGLKVTGHRNHVYTPCSLVQITSYPQIHSVFAGPGHCDLLVELLCGGRTSSFSNTCLLSACPPLPLPGGDPMWLTGS